MDIDRGRRRGDGAVDFFCAVCGRVAGTLRMAAAGEEVATGPLATTMQFEGATVRTSGFMYVITVVVGAESAERLWQVLSQDAPPTADVKDPDWELVPFFCKGCQRTYCRRHWDLSFNTITEYTHGTCPRGHRQLVDD
jgi:hypothetical protein